VFVLGVFECFEGGDVFGCGGVDWIGCDEVDVYFVWVEVVGEVV